MAIDETGFWTANQKFGWATFGDPDPLGRLDPGIRLVIEGLNSMCVGIGEALKVISRDIDALKAQLLSQPGQAGHPGHPGNTPHRSIR